MADWLKKYNHFHMVLGIGGTWKTTQNDQTFPYLMDCYFVFIINFFKGPIFYLFSDQ